jgi:hypothetical protein
MFLHWLSALIKWIATVGLIGGLFYLAYQVNGEMQAERAREGSGDKVQSPRRAKDGVVGLGVENADRYGLEEESARAISWSERVPVYGQMVSNPRATVELRSPFAGTLRAASDGDWPKPGRWVRSGQALGWVDIRVGTQERLSLQDNLNTARHKKEGAEKVVPLQRERVNRLEKVSRSQIVPGQQLDDARVLLAEAETQLAIATAAVELWQKALVEVDRPGGDRASTYSYPLMAPADGEVTELAAQPGMSVEAGGVIAQLVDFRRPLVRIDMPPQILAAGPPSRLQLFAIPASPPVLSGVAAPREVSGPTPSVAASLAGPAPRLDAASQFVGYWYTVDTTLSQGTAEQAGPKAADGGGLGAVWRPGLQVRADVRLPSARVQQAISVPASAVLFHQGRSLVYVRLEPGAYERRDVRLLGREGGRWVLAPRQDPVPSGLAPGEAVVRRGAQVLLSEEFRSDVEAD